MSVSSTHHDLLDSTDREQFLNSVLANISGQSSSNAVEKPPPYNPKPTHPTDFTSKHNVTSKKRKADEAFVDPKSRDWQSKDEENRDGQSNTMRPNASESTAGTSKKAFPSPEDKPAPKKGSFQEIMARAQLNKVVPYAGKIQHKKITPKTAEERRAWRANHIKDRRKPQSGRSSKSSSPGPRAEKGKSTMEKDEKQVNPQKITRSKPRIETSYRGTANLHRSKPDSDTNKRHGRSAALSNASRAKWQQETESEDIDDRDDFDSDVSSDMEATGFDVEEEEMKSALTAKREDELALKEEEELRQAKERRRRLAALANKRR
jgi:protein SPT2